MRKLWILLVLAGCGSKTKFPSDDRADRVVIDCPTGQALDRAADAAWGTDKTAEHAVTCVPLYNREPLWLLYGTVTGDTAIRGAALTTTTNELRWKDVQPATDDVITFTTVDLDGDAHDELLAETPTGVVPYGIADGKAVAGPELALVEGDCVIDHEVVVAPRGRHLVQLRYGSACKIQGTHVYGWDGQQLVEE